MVRTTGYRLPAADLYALAQCRQSLCGRVAHSFAVDLAPYPAALLLNAAQELLRLE